MSEFIPWDSQPYEEWTSKHAPGKIIDLDGNATHYIEKGRGEPVILIHGFFYNYYMWAKNIAALAEKFRVFAIDLWGFGYSTRRPLDYGYSLYSEQLLKFMNALEIEKASLIGQSLGGGTSVLFATENRERVNKLVLVSPAGLPNPYPLIAKIPTLPGVGEFFLGLQNNFARKIALYMGFIHNKNIITEEYFDNVTRPHKIKDSSKVILTILRKQFFDTLCHQFKSLGEMNIPALIVWGRNDNGIPLKNAREMNTILKGSRLEILENAGHCPHDEQSEQFNRLVLDFLS
jgi:pimeloyl-ACP methyl ester carboxylesterase